MSEQDHLRRGNLLWEGSRMMLPEHKERLLSHRRQLGSRARPELDEQQLQEFSQTLALAMQEELRVAVRLYAPTGDEPFEGRIIALSAVRRAVKLRREDDGEQVWIALADIVGLSIP